MNFYYLCVKQTQRMIRACIFDLDGVIVDTAKFHFIAWKAMANNVGVEFTENDNEQLKGVGRMESLEFILDLGDVSKSQEEKEKLANEKNEHYKKLISNISQEEILPGVLFFLDELKSKGIKIALGSASKNARTILTALSITNYFDVIIDGTNTTRSKPDPQVFTLGAEALGIQPKEIVVFEDAVKGVEAAKAGDFYAIGVGDSEVLSQADAVISGFEDFSFQQLNNLLN